MMKKVWLMLAMMVCILASCSNGGSEDPVNPTPKPEEVKTEITIDSSIISNGLSFGVAGSEQSVSFSVNANWTLSVASTTSGATWCKASATSGSKGSATVKFTVDENTGYDDRSVSVTIKAGSVSKTFTITQKGTDALLVTTTKYEVEQEGGQIEIEVKANIDYQMTISETAKDWIGEVSGRALTTHKHKLNIAMNEDAKKREGEIYFKSGDKVETVKVYQAGGAIILLSQDEYTVSDAGETVSVDIKSNVEYGVQMPDVDWITDEVSGRGMSSHTLKYIVSANETYDSRSAEIIFYDKNSDLKDTLKVVQAQKDAIVISQKEYNVKAEGETIEVKLSANVDFEVTMPEVDWIKQVSSRALKEHTLYFEVAENEGEDSRSLNIIITNKDSQISESITINQVGVVKAGNGTYKDGVVSVDVAGNMKKLLGDDYLNITSLKVIGPINGDDIYYLAKMLGRNDFSEADRGKLTTLDLSEATIVEGGEWYYENWHSKYYTSDNVIGDYMFSYCANLMKIELPKNITSIGAYAFKDSDSLTSMKIPDKVTSIGEYAFQYCSSLKETTIFSGEIASQAFYGCPALKSVVVGDGVTSIGNQAFNDCFVLESVVIGDGVTTIGDGAFRFCPALKSVVVGNGVTSIGSQAFEGCYNITDFYIKDLSAWCKIDFGSHTLYSGVKLYLNNNLVTELIIPDDVTEIKDYTFEGFESLTKITIPDHVTTIGNGSFEDCSALTNVVIGDGVTSIGDDAFEGCSALTNVVIGDGVTSIGDDAFYGCSALTSVVIGDSVTSIGYRAFVGCGALTECYCYATIPPSIKYDESESFSTFPLSNNATLYVPERCGSAYKISYWGNYFNNIVEME